jgi:hypothetical protein
VERLAVVRDRSLGFFAIGLLGSHGERIVPRGNRSPV